MAYNKPSVMVKRINGNILCSLSDIILTDETSYIYILDDCYVIKHQKSNMDETKQQRKYYIILNKISKQQYSL